METIIKNKTQIPEITTEQIFVNSDEERVGEVYEQVDAVIDSLKLYKTDALHMKLLFEETIGMIKAITEDFTALVWAERYNDECWLRLMGKTKMNIDKRLDLMSVSSSGENALAVGFMGKIKDIVETGMLTYDGVSKLQQKYNGYGFDCDGPVKTIGPSTNPTSYSGFVWTMDEYKQDLNNDKSLEAKGYWDELEKSIVASIAKNVIVGIDKNQIEMAIIMDI